MEHLRAVQVLQFSIYRTCTLTFPSRTFCWRPCARGVMVTGAGRKPLAPEWYGNTALIAAWEALFAPRCRDTGRRASKFPYLQFQGVRGGQSATQVAAEATAFMIRIACTLQIPRRPSSTPNRMRNFCSHGALRPWTTTGPAFQRGPHPFSAIPPPGSTPLRMRCLHPIS